MRRTPPAACRTARVARNRRGTIIAWSIFALAVAGSLTALAVNRLWISGVRADSQQCVDAAALAAAQVMLTDDLLRPQQFPVLEQWREERSRTTARTIVEHYRALHHIPAPEQLTVWWDDSADAAEQRLPRSVSVAFGSRDSVPRAPLLLPGLTGVPHAAAGAAATVMLLNQPAAFRPAIGVDVPMLPLCLQDGSNTPDLESWAKQIEQFGGPDRLAWSTELQQTIAGPDGLPELRIRIGRSGEAGGMLFLPLSCRFDSEPFQRSLRSGLSVDHLLELSRTEIAFPSDTLLASDYTVDLARSLTEITGHPRIICLVVLSADGPHNQTELSAELVRPVAARILQVTTDDSGGVLITLQPCVMSTRTTRSAAAAPRNRYIYDIRL